MNGEIEIRLWQGEAEAEAAARLMSNTEPWIRLGSKFENTIKSVKNPEAEVYVAVVDGTVAGVILLGLRLPLIKGYIAGLAVHKDYRNRGVGAKLLGFAEERIFKISPNVFLTVSSFNDGAQRFYKRLGYEQVGLLKEYGIEGADELLMRKTKGPWSKFKPAT